MTPLTDRVPLNRHSQIAKTYILGSFVLRRYLVFFFIIFFEVEDPNTIVNFVNCQ